MNIRLYFFFIITFFSVSLTAQSSNTGTWFAYLGNQPISKKLSLHNEIQYRDYGFIGDMQQLLLRTGIGYNLSENNNNLLLGIALIQSRNYIGEETSTNTEHRIWQQFITRQRFGRVYWLHRYRLEERFLPYDFQMRFRYFLSFNYPITKKEMSAKTLYASVYDEIFLKFQSPIFDRNRLYAGLGYVINPNLRIEVGFMAQSLERRNRNQIVITCFNNIPFLTKN